MVIEYTLLSTIVGSIVAAFILGFLAQQVKLPPILGYLLAGILIGPHTPGFVADVKLAKQLAEIGIILLMFGVGLHFSFKDLMNVRRVALPGALVQMATATLMGAAVVVAAGYPLSTGLVFGFCLSVASTVVLLRALEQRGLVSSETGKIAVGWLIVEDIAMVLAIVLLPVIAGMLAAGQGLDLRQVGTEVFTVLLKIGGFIVLMLVVGRRVLPPLLHRIAKTGSGELMTLCTLGIALGFAYLAYSAFDASFALGAFLAGLVLNESHIGHESAEKTQPLRDTFAVLFFVSVGMLFDPGVLVQSPGMVALTVLIITVGKSIAALAIARLFRQGWNTSFTIATSLAQIGEFSFILAGMAVVLGLLPDDLYNLILAGALLSIAINPLLFGLLVREQKKRSGTIPVSC